MAIITAGNTQQPNQVAVFRANGSVLTLKKISDTDWLLFGDLAEGDSEGFGEEDGDPPSVPAGCPFVPDFGGDHDQSVSFGVLNSKLSTTIQGVDVVVIFAEGTAYTGILGIPEMGTYSTNKPDVLGDDVIVLLMDGGELPIMQLMAQIPTAPDGDTTVTIGGVAIAGSFDGGTLLVESAISREIFNQISLQDEVCISIDPPAPPPISNLVVSLDETSLQEDILKVTVTNEGPDAETSAAVRITSSEFNTLKIFDPVGDFVGSVNWEGERNWNSALQWDLGNLGVGQTETLTIPIERVNWQETTISASPRGNNVPYPYTTTSLVYEEEARSDSPVVIEVTGPGTLQISGWKRSDASRPWAVENPIGVFDEFSSNSLSGKSYEIPEGDHEIRVYDSGYLSFSSTDETLFLSLIDFGDTPDTLRLLTRNISYVPPLPPLPPSMNGFFGSGVIFGPAAIDAINNWDVSNVTSMESMFKEIDASSLDLSEWDVSNVTNMNRMFENGSSQPYRVGYPSGIGEWDVSNVTDMGHMFDGNTLVSSPDPANEVPDISNWDVSSVENFANMFRNNKKLTNQDLSNWNMASAENLSGMFARTTFNGNIQSWDTKNVTNMSRMFDRNPIFNWDISGWDVGNVENMGYMFYEATSFDQDISGWSVSSVVDMGSMFSGATSFNQDLSGWCVTNIVSKPSGFDTNTPAWVKENRQPVWGTCP